MINKGKYITNKGKYIFNKGKYIINKGETLVVLQSTRDRELYRQRRQQ